MATQLLVNVLSVGPLAPSASVTLAHGIRSNDVDVPPTLIQPDRASPIVVTAVTPTTATFQNLGADPAFAKFRCERGLSNELDATTVGTMYWQGAASGGGGGGVAPGLVPAPTGGPFADGSVVAINNSGALVLADADSINTAPAVGIYVTVDTVGYIRVAGEQTGLSGLTAGTLYYTSGIAGELSSSPPAGPGAVVQVVGRALTTTSLFVSPTVIVLN